MKTAAPQRLTAVVDDALGPDALMGPPRRWATANTPNRRRLRSMTIVGTIHQPLEGLGNGG